MRSDRDRMCVCVCISVSVLWGGMGDRRDDKAITEDQGWLVCVCVVSAYTHIHTYIPASGACPAPARSGLRRSHLAHTAADWGPFARGTVTVYNINRVRV